MQYAVTTNAVIVLHVWKPISASVMGKKRIESQNNYVICQHDLLEMGFQNHGKFSLSNGNYFIFQIIIFHLNSF